MIANVIAFVALLVSLGVGYLTIRWAGRQAWYNLITQRCDALLESAAREWVIMDNLLAWPPRPAREKLAEELFEEREKMGQQVALLVLVFPDRADLLSSAREAASLSWNDTFLESEANTLDEKTRKKLREEFQKPARVFIGEVRGFAEVVGDPGLVPRKGLRRTLVLVAVFFIVLGTLGVIVWDGVREASPSEDGAGGQDVSGRAMDSGVVPESRTRSHDQQ